MLLCCGMISVAIHAARDVPVPGIDQGLQLPSGSLPSRFLLPPVYAAVAPIPFMAVLQFFVHRGVLHRRVFTAASISLPYAAVSLAVPLVSALLRRHDAGHRAARASPGCLAVAACEILGGRVQHFLIVGAVKMTDPSVRLRRYGPERAGARRSFSSRSTSASSLRSRSALSSTLVVIALPTVLLVRRFLDSPGPRRPVARRCEDRPAQRLHLGDPRPRRSSPGRPAPAPRSPSP